MFNLIIWSAGFIKNRDYGAEQVWEKHFPVKSIIILGLLGIKVRVSDEINIFKAAVSRYLSPAVYIVNEKELKDPDMGALVSPE